MTTLEERLLFIIREAKSLRHDVLRARPMKAQAVAGGLSMLERVAAEALLELDDAEQASTRLALVSAC